MLGLSAVLFAGSYPLAVNPAAAEAVKVQNAQMVPSFADVVEAAGDTPVLFDSGVRSGSDAVKALADAPGKKLVIAGFHDPSGDATINHELAKNRAKAVRAAITSQGVDAARVALRKPEQTAADGPADEARRVEIRLVTLP